LVHQCNCWRHNGRTSDWSEETQSPIQGILTHILSGTNNRHTGRSGHLAPAGL
jgi:hypothetical protein